MFSAWSSFAFCSIFSICCFFFCRHLVAAFLHNEKWNLNNAKKAEHKFYRAFFCTLLPTNSRNAHMTKTYPHHLHHDKVSFTSLFIHESTGVTQIHTLTLLMHQELLNAEYRVYNTIMLLFSYASNCCRWLIKKLLVRTAICDTDV